MIKGFNVLRLSVDDLVGLMIVIVVKCSPIKITSSKCVAIHCSTKYHFCNDVLYALFLCKLTVSFFCILCSRRFLLVLYYFYKLIVVENKFVQF